MTECLRQGSVVSSPRSGAGQTTAVSNIASRAMQARPSETELKFRVGADALERLRGHPELQGREQVSHLKSVYFDTAARDLARRSLALRVRNTGGGFVQTVKQRDGAGGFTRGEWEEKVPTDAVDLDALAKTPAGKVLKGKLHRLRPVFSTNVDRLARYCRTEGNLIEVSFDSGEIVSDGHSEPIHELELELKTGNVAALFAIGRMLVSEMSVRLSFESKADRGYRASDQTELEPRVSIDPPCPPDALAGEIFQRVARRCLAQTAANAELFQVAQRQEAVHQMRVGLRRLGAALSAFRPMLRDDGVLLALNGERKWLTAELDVARDLDVFIESTFRPVAEATGDVNLAALGWQLLTAQTAAYERVMTAVKSKRFATMVFETAVWIESGPWAHIEAAEPSRLPTTPVKAFARETLDRLYKRARKRGRKFGHLDSHGRHKLRICIKELRYATQFFQSVFGANDKTHARFLAGLERVQNQLGALNDIAMARDRILQEAQLEQPKLIFAAGRITGRREREEATLLGAAKTEFKSFCNTAPFWVD